MSFFKILYGDSFFFIDFDRIDVDLDSLLILQDAPFFLKPFLFLNKPIMNVVVSFSDVFLKLELQIFPSEKILQNCHFLFQYFELCSRFIHSPVRGNQSSGFVNSFLAFKFTLRKQFMLNLLIIFQTFYKLDVLWLILE